MKPKYHQAGALYDIVQPTKDVCNPAEEWNHFLLTVNHEINNANVKLNGTREWVSKKIIHIRKKTPIIA